MDTSVTGRRMGGQLLIPVMKRPLMISSTMVSLLPVCLRSLFVEPSKLGQIGTITLLGQETRPITTHATNRELGYIWSVAWVCN